MNYFGEFSFNSPNKIRQSIISHLRQSTTMRVPPPPDFPPKTCSPDCASSPVSYPTTMVPKHCPAWGPLFVVHHHHNLSPPSSPKNTKKFNNLQKADFTREMKRKQRCQRNKGRKRNLVRGMLVTCHFWLRSRRAVSSPWASPSTNELPCWALPCTHSLHPGYYLISRLHNHHGSVNIGTQLLQREIIHQRSLKNKTTIIVNLSLKN